MGDRGRLLRLCLTVAVLAGGAWAASIIYQTRQSWEYVAYDLIVSIAGVLIAAVVWDQRPRSIVGPLLFVGTSWYLLSPVRSEANAWLITASFIAVAMSAPMFGHLVLAHPAGHLEHRGIRRLVRLAYVTTAVFVAVQLAIGSAGQFFDGCAGSACPSNPPWLGDGAPSWFGAVDDARSTLNGVLAVVLIALLVHRLIIASPRRRRQLLPVFITAMALIGHDVVFDVLGLGGWPADDISSHLTHLAFALAFLYGIFQTRRERASIADVLAAAAASPGSELQPLLARALRDPDLQLVATAPGAAAATPVPTPGRTASVVHGARSPLGFLVHEEALVHDDELLASVLAAAGLALDNELMRDELRTQLDEVRTSRQRIVEAGDNARHRLERDLHDGAQQRLLGVGIALQLATRSLPDAERCRGLLDEAQNEIGAALHELRELARGLHPAVLTDHGLDRAVRLLAERSVVPVTIAGDVPDDIPIPLATAVYYVVSESLQNACKHSDAATVTVNVQRVNGAVCAEIRDDGRGGADARLGSGLSGLQDRLEALGGSLHVESCLGVGTAVRIELPCG